MTVLQQIKSLLKGKSDKEAETIVNRFIEFDNPNNYIGGVYQIENFYVGKSSNFKRRITEHVLELLKIPDAKIVFNKEKLYLIESVLKKRKLKVKVLSNDQNKEESYIKDLYNKIPLTNIKEVTDEMRAMRRRNHFKITIGKTLKIVTFSFGGRFIVATVTVDKTVIFKIAKTKKEAVKKLEDYLNRTPSSSSKRGGKKNKYQDTRPITEHRYVAVRAGRVIGVYKQFENWKEQIDGFEGASMRGFDDIRDAINWVKNETPTNAMGTPLRKKRGKNKKKR